MVRAEDLDRIDAQVQARTLETQAIANMQARQRKAAEDAFRLSETARVRVLRRNGLL